ncbi:PfkB family carbohydrate kinase, partial [Extibacter muris]|uniref:PfkB family carbohydrate kinase n=1 Tax=Extibacter muris TaxID=1796622 RepID=UPI00210BC0BC
TRGVLKECVRLGTRIAVGTRGSEPAVAYAGARYYSQDICKGTAVDPMGAGDSYISAFLSNYLSAEADEP